MITNTYNRYELDVTSISLNDIKRIAHFIQPEHIISLRFNNHYSIEQKIDLFFELFDSNQFCRLVSLTLNEINQDKVNHILKDFADCPRLVSLSIKANENWNYKTKVNLLSKVIKFKLRKLNLKDFNSLINNIPWQDISTVQHIILEDCTFSQYQIILSSLPHLKTFVMRDCIINDHNQMLLMSYPQLISLSINDCHLSINDIQFVISQTPSLVYLNLVSYRKEFDLAFNGSFWEQFIQTNFSSMAKFQFFFSYSIYRNDVIIDFDTLIHSFRTSFWLNNIICDYNIQRKIINLYTMPILITESDNLWRSIGKSSTPSIAIRWIISSMDVNCSPKLNLIDGIFDVTSSTKVFLIFNTMIFIGSLFY
jgi:hypothetical protein